MSPCGKVFGEGVTDGVAFKVVCGEQDQLCHPCRIELGKEEEAEKLRLEVADSNEAATDKSNLG